MSSLVRNLQNAMEEIGLERPRPPELVSYSTKAREFVELHDQTETSVDLLDQLENFLSNFRKELTQVSGQISELQDRSKKIEHRLKSRRKIEKPLSDLISDITISPALAKLILDTEVGEPWIDSTKEFEDKLEKLKSRTKVKAARDMSEIAEGLRIVAATKLRAFFLSLFHPIRTKVTTNMQVIQTSVLLKFRNLFSFLQRQAQDVANELRTSYIAAARVYYETGFRRYARSLSWIKSRTTEKFETLVVEREEDTSLAWTRLRYANIDGPAVTLAYMADDKSHKDYVEALFRSLLLVLMDNATAEYMFITTFFCVSGFEERGNVVLSPFPIDANVERPSRSGSEIDLQGQSKEPGVSDTHAMAVKEDRGNLDALWKQIMEPVLEHCQTFTRSVLEPMPPIVPLLTMIRLVEDVIGDVQKRGCGPLESFLFGIRLQMWPVFQKAMHENIEAVKKVASMGNVGFFNKGPSTTDASVIDICQRYVALFSSLVSLTEPEEETMIFANLLRLREEITKLIIRHSDALPDSFAKATKQSSLFERLLQGFSKGPQVITHPKMEKEIAYWAEKEAEACRRIVSVRKGKNKA